MFLESVEDQGFELQKNNVVYNVGTLYEEWSISFDLMITELHDGVFNIIRVGDSIGSRLPAIFLKDKSSALEVRLAEGNLSFKSNPIPLNSWTNVRMFVRLEIENGGYAFNVVIDNVTVFWNRIPDPATYSNIYIYASDNFQAVPDARIRNIEHETSPKEGMSHINHFAKYDIQLLHFSTKFVVRAEFQPLR